MIWFRLLPGFARGAYVRRAPRVVFKRMAVGPKALRGWSLQMHLRSGIRYVDLVLYRVARRDQRVGVEPTEPW